MGEELSKQKHNILDSFFNIEDLYDLAGAVTQKKDDVGLLITETFEALNRKPYMELKEIVDKGEKRTFLLSAMRTVYLKRNSSFNRYQKGSDNIHNTNDEFFLDVNGETEDLENLMHTAMDSDKTTKLEQLIDDILSQKQYRTLDHWYDQVLWTKRVRQNKMLKDIKYETRTKDRDGIPITSIHYAVQRVNKLLKKEIKNYMERYDLDYEDLLKNQEE